MRSYWSALLLAASIAGAHAATPLRAAAPADPALDRRVAALSAQLRCVVCQNQTIADSQAALAVDLRQQVREKLAQGMAEQEVLDFVAQRYGDFVLYRPPLRPATVLLWFGPALLLVAGVLVLRARLRPRQQPAAAPPSHELARAARLLADDRELP